MHIHSFVIEPGVSYLFPGDTKINLKKKACVKQSPQILAINKW